MENSNHYCLLVATLFFLLLTWLMSAPPQEQMNAAPQEQMSAEAREQMSVAAQEQMSAATLAQEGVADKLTAGQELVTTWWQLRHKLLGLLQLRSSGLLCQSSGTVGFCSTWTGKGSSTGSCDSCSSETAVTKIWKPGAVLQKLPFSKLKLKIRLFKIWYYSSKF